jgi:hypothetical protein
MRTVLIVLALCGLAACSKPAAGSYSDEAPARSARLAPPGAGGQPDSGDAAAPRPPQLAYAYKFALWTPRAALEGLLARHQDACRAAGFQVCLVTASAIDSANPGEPFASLTLRATPAWIERFRRELAVDARGVGGRLTAVDMSSEDLTRRLVDTDATLHARTALRDRLQALLQSRPGKAADLVEIETALAKVQEELDAARSEMNDMRSRVALSEVQIDYQSAPRLGALGTGPLGRAIGGFGDNLTGGLAFLITAVAALLPVAVFLALVVWLARLWLRRRSGAHTARGRPI